MEEKKAAGEMMFVCVLFDQGMIRKRVRRERKKGKGRLMDGMQERRVREREKDEGRKGDSFFPIHPHSAFLTGSKLS